MDGGDLCCRRRAAALRIYFAWIPSLRFFSKWPQEREREEVENDEGRATAEYKCLKLMREQDSERDIGRLR